jgi:trehalose 6-phosphate phosphatase
VIEKGLDTSLERLARTPVLLVASDYDGTLAPIVEDPAAAAPLREAIVALRLLAELPSTHVAVISGRSLADLAELSGLGPPLHLVGSHGSEFDAGFAESLSPVAVALRERIREELESIARQGPGLHVEHKPGSLALHFRRASSAVGERALEAVARGPGALPDVTVKHGKQVVELGVVSTDKGQALRTVRQRLGATAVLFFGDDVTDEDVFVALAGPDVGVKVGEGESAARLRVADPTSVAQALARLATLRADWLTGEGATPIERHSLLSDLRTAALVDDEARVTWLCLPRIDSPAVFAELLGGPSAGYFSVRPIDGGTPRQAYVGETMLLESRWPDLRVVDFLDCSHGRPGHRAGRSDLVRLLEGRGRAVIELAPRLDFGRVPTRIEVRDGGLVVLEAPDPLVLRASGLRWELIERGGHHTARAVVDLDQIESRRVDLVLCWGAGSLRASDSVAAREAESSRFWSTWAEPLTAPPLHRELVVRSALLLRALCHGPSGALVAAATTSLPESLEGVRNWDYRYCWPRDAALAAAALLDLGSSNEAMALLEWLTAVVESCESPERLRPLYTVAGTELGPEAEIRELPGYRGSRPVRVGNAAAGQVQLDIFGPIVDLVARLAEAGAPLRAGHWRLVESMVEAVSRRWEEPDHGIWEVRRPKRHHVHSKVMCWMALDRASLLEERFLDRRRPEWTELRDRIADDVLTRGYKRERHAFTSAYDGDDLDAAALWLGLSGLLPGNDPRFVGTVEAVERELREGPTVYRYRGDDGLPGHEGGFHLCASWLVDAYLLVGRHDAALELFEQLCACAGPTGLLAEQIDPSTATALGNVPQAYSHLGLIGNAVKLAAFQ